MPCVWNADPGGSSTIWATAIPLPAKSAPRTGAINSFLIFFPHSVALLRAFRRHANTHGSIKAEQANDLSPGSSWLGSSSNPHSRSQHGRVPRAPRKSPFGDIAPALGEYTDNVLFGDVWKRPQLSPRDRSLVTVSSLVAQYRINELPFHLKFALQNGVTREELIEAITHLAFYAGWPTASTAIGIARRVFDEEGK